MYDFKPIVRTLRLKRIQEIFDVIEIGAYVCSMAITTIKSTYSLDVGTVRALEALARRWNVSKSEALRRAIRIAASEDNPSQGTALAALDRLQTSLRERKVDVTQWTRELKAKRRAASRRTASNPDDPSGS